MFKKSKPARDPFTFSLGGMRTVASFMHPHVVADDRIRKAREDRLRRTQDDQPETAAEMTAIKGRFWLQRRLRRAA